MIIYLWCPMQTWAHSNSRCFGMNCSALLLCFSIQSVHGSISLKKYSSLELELAIALLTFKFNSSIKILDDKMFRMITRYALGQTYSAALIFSLHKYFVDFVSSLNWLQGPGQRTDVTRLTTTIWNVMMKHLR